MKKDGLKSNGCSREDVNCAGVTSRRAPPSGSVTGEDRLDNDVLSPTQVLQLRRPTHEFYLKRALDLAPLTLGLIVAHITPEGMTAGRITEAEAYEGPEDRACHAFGGRRTARTEVMFGPPGFAYIYFTYGNHWMLNFVVAGEGIPHAVLIRSIEPITGSGLMRERRKGMLPLAIGPGRLTQAMAIKRADNAKDLTEGDLFVAYPPDGFDYPVKCRVTKRIGVGNTGEAKDYLWRFVDGDSPPVYK